jgi:hypothetical protein
MELQPSDRNVGTGLGETSQPEKSLENQKLQALRLWYLTGSPDHEAVLFDSLSPEETLPKESSPGSTPRLLAEMLKREMDLAQLKAPEMYELLNSLSLEDQVRFTLVQEFGEDAPQQPFFQPLLNQVVKKLSASKA